MKKNVLKLSIAVVAVAGVMLLGSCMKNKNDFKPNPQSGLFILHAASGAPGVDIYLNKDKITQSAFSFTTTGTTTIKPDDYTLSFVTPVNGDTVATVSDSLRNGHSYSAILYNTADAVKLMFFQDQYEQAQSGPSSFLRFLQLSPGQNAVSIFIDNDKFVSNRHFADNIADPKIAKFRPLSGGRYNITATDAAGDTIDHLVGVQLVNRGYYTLYLSGNDTATVDTLKTRLRVARSY